MPVGSPPSHTRLHQRHHITVIPDHTSVILDAHSPSFPALPFVAGAFGDVDAVAIVERIG